MISNLDTLSRVEIIKPKLTKYQKQILECSARYTVTEAGTKVGKTFSHLWWLFEQAHKNAKAGAFYWWVAPVYSQAAIAFKRLLRVVEGTIGYKVNRSLMEISTPTGATIVFKSADNADSLYGEDVMAAVFDEFTRAKEESWHALRSTLTATHGKCKLIGNARGKGHWSYGLVEKGMSNDDNDYKYFRVTAWDAVEAGILTREEIEQARKDLPDNIFRSLYLAEHVSMTDKPYIYTFDESTHVTDSITLNKNLPVYLSFDFNVSPMTCTVHQFVTGKYYYTLDEFRLMNSGTHELCQVIKNSIYGKCHLIVTGDATGRNRAALSGNITNYSIIARELKINRTQIRVPRSNPPLSESRALSNIVMARHPNRKIHKRCEYLLEDIRYVESDDRDNPKPQDVTQGHLLDTLRYMDNTFFTRYALNH